MDKLCFKTKACKFNFAGFVFNIKFLISIIIIIQACSSGKYYADFKNSKKSIDTLAVMQPVIFIESNESPYDLYDPVLSGQVQNQIFEKAYSVLSKKYFIDLIENSIDTLQSTDINKLFVLLENSENKESKIEIPELIRKSISGIQPRYCLLVFFKGFYTRGYAKISGTSNTIAFNISGQKMLSSDMRLVIFDKVANDVVYYNRKESSADPQVPYNIIKCTSDIIRPIYYK